ncbi:MAG: hypothetical protein UHW86_05770 [Spirochaetota bacterium]|nr:hypothetical protein [Spirochaetota bacterium]
MKRLIAVLLVLVGSVSMSFACKIICKNSYCGKQVPRDTCSKSSRGHHTGNISINYCDYCPTCDHCSEKHPSDKCTKYNKGYNDGFSGKKNPCASYGYEKSQSGYFKDKQESVEKTCNTGYKDGYNDYLELKAKEEALKQD